jgi:hypothetical protein
MGMYLCYLEVALTMMLVPLLLVMLAQGLMLTTMTIITSMSTDHTIEVLLQPLT